jgi:hypothetical protein
LILAYIGSHKRVSAAQAVFVGVFLSAGMFLVITPEMANRIASLLGVGRGADLLLYFSVLVGVFAGANFYFRFRQNEQTLIAIVRELALSRPLQEQGPPRQRTHNETN